MSLPMTSAPGLACCMLLQAEGSLRCCNTCSIGTLKSWIMTGHVHCIHPAIAHWMEAQFTSVQTLLSLMDAFCTLPPVTSSSACIAPVQ